MSIDATARKFAKISRFVSPSDEDDVRDVRDGISRMGRKRVVSESRFENEKWKRKKSCKRTKSGVMMDTDTRN